MKKSEGLYLIRDESEGLGTGEGKGTSPKDSERVREGDEWRSHWEKGTTDLRNSDTVCKVCEEASAKHLKTSPMDLGKYTPPPQP